MSSQQPVAKGNMHVMEDGILVDPTTDKPLGIQNPKNWTAQANPPPDVHCVIFSNMEIDYASYDPPKGFTAEEIMQFNGASDCLTIEKVNNLIKQRDQEGTLDLHGDDRWKYEN